MELDLPKLEHCKECEGVKITTWTDGGMTTTQTHKPQCPVLADLKKQYPQTWYPGM